MNICIDWITFTLEVDKYFGHDEVSNTQEAAIEFARMWFPDIGFGEEGWQLGRGRYFFSDKLSYQGFEILFNGMKKEMDGLICVNVSGQGCRTWETIDGNILNLLDIAEDNAYKVSRIDLACDDREGMLDIDQIYKLSGMRFKKDGELSSECFWWGNSRYNSRTQGSDGCTLYFGAPSSEIRIRINDKAAEQKIEDYWIRVEIQFRDDRAKAVLSNVVNEDSPGKVFAGVLRNQLFFLTSLLQNLTRLMHLGIHKIMFVPGGMISCRLPNRLS